MKLREGGCEEGIDILQGSKWLRTPVELQFNHGKFWNIQELKNFNVAQTQMKCLISTHFVTTIETHFYWIGMELLQGRK